MNENKKFLISTLVMFFIAWQLLLVAGFVVMKYALPGAWIEYTHVVNLFFFVAGVSLIFILNKSLYGRSRDPRKMTNIYLLVKMIKFLLTMLLLVVGMKIYEQYREPFAVVVAVNYFIYLVTDILIYYRYEKRYKQLNQQKTE